MKGKYWGWKHKRVMLYLIQLNAGIGLGMSIDVMWESVIYMNVTFLFWSLSLEIWVRKYEEDALKVKVARDKITDDCLEQTIEFG